MEHHQLLQEDLPYFIVPWHYHPEIEIMCIEQGSGTRFVGDHIENYEVGDVCIIGPQLPMNGGMTKSFSEKEPDCVPYACVCISVKSCLRGHD